VDVNGDLLSAAALLVAAVGAVFGLWQPEINGAVNLTVKPLRDSRDKDIIHVRAMVRRATYLAIINWLLVIVFMPPALRIGWDAIQTVYSDPTSAWRRYDAVSAAFSVVIGIGVILGLAACRSRRQLKAKLTKLEAPDP
jgi:hypothetical protein